MKIVIDETIRKEIKELFDKEVAYRRTILMLSMEANKANEEMWKVILKVHPELKEHISKKCSFQTSTWKVIIHGNDPSINN